MEVFFKLIVHFLEGINFIGVQIVKSQSVRQTLIIILYVNFKIIKHFFTAAGEEAEHNIYHRRSYSPSLPIYQFYSGEWLFSISTLQKKIEILFEFRFWNSPNLRFQRSPFMGCEENSSVCDYFIFNNRLIEQYFSFSSQIPIFEKVEPYCLLWKLIPRASYCRRRQYFNQSEIVNNTFLAVPFHFPLSKTVAEHPSCYEVEIIQPHFEILGLW